MPSQAQTGHFKNYNGKNADDSVDYEERKHQKLDVNMSGIYQNKTPQRIAQSAADVKSSASKSYVYNTTRGGQSKKKEMIPVKHLGDSETNSLQRDSRSNVFSESDKISVAAKSAQLLKLVLMSQSQLKEIKTYTANELFKNRNKTNDLIKEFNKIKQMREDIGTVKLQA